jgi:hypothetical protein
MTRPDDLTIKLHHDEVHYHEEDGFGYFQTLVGSCLWQLREMWGMSYTEVIEKIAIDAAIKEEEFVVNGEYIPPHARGGSGWPHQSAMDDGPVVYH